MPDFQIILILSHLRSTDSGGGIGYVSSLNSQNKLFVGVYIDIRLNCDIFPPQPANVRPEVTNNLIYEIVLKYNFRVSEPFQ